MPANCAVRVKFISFKLLRSTNVWAITSPVPINIPVCTLCDTNGYCLKSVLYALRMPLITINKFKRIDSLQFSGLTLAKLRVPKQEQYATGRLCSRKENNVLQCKPYVVT